MKLKYSDITANTITVATTCLLMENSKETIKAIVETDKWKLPKNDRDKEIDVTVQFNGVECDPHVLEKLLTGWHERISEKLSKQYSDIEAEIERRVNDRVEKIVKENIEPYQEKLANTIDTLNVASSNLAHLPHIGGAEWENGYNWKSHETVDVTFNGYTYTIYAPDARILVGNAISKKVADES